MYQWLPLKCAHRNPKYGLKTGVRAIGKRGGGCYKMEIEYEVQEVRRSECANRAM